MFRFTRKSSSGSHNQYLVKITHLVKSRYVEAVQDVVSVMAAYAYLSCGGHLTTNNMRGWSLSLKLKEMKG